MSIESNHVSPEQENEEVHAAHAESVSLQSDTSHPENSKAEYSLGTPEWNVRTFNLMRNDKRLRSFLAVSLGNSSSAWDKMTDGEVGEFYRRFPSKLALEMSPNIENFLTRLAAGSGEQKAQEYRETLPAFIALMFPSKG